MNCYQLNILMLHGKTPSEKSKLAPKLNHEKNPYKLENITGIHRETIFFIIKITYIRLV